MTKSSIICQEHNNHLHYSLQVHCNLHLIKLAKFYSDSFVQQDVGWYNQSESREKEWKSMLQIEWNFLFLDSRWHSLPAITDPDWVCSRSLKRVVCLLQTSGFQFS